VHRVVEQGVVGMEANHYLVAAQHAGDDGGVVALKGGWRGQNSPAAELAYVPTNASYLNRIECHFTALRHFALNGTDCQSHEEQNSWSAATSPGDTATSNSLHFVLFHCAQRSPDAAPALCGLSRDASRRRQKVTDGLPNPRPRFSWALP
jgi:hypothetical protein